MAVPDLAHAVWRKSIRSTGGGNNCVELAPAGGGIVGVRDSKQPEAEPLVLDADAWAAVTAQIKAGQFDL